MSVTDWDHVPLSVGLAQCAQILGVSERSIARRLADGSMSPAPRRDGRAWKWSKAKLRAHVDGVPYSPITARRRHAA